MKRLLIGIALFAYTASPLHTMENPNPPKKHICENNDGCKECSIACKRVLGPSKIPQIKQELLAELKTTIILRATPNPYPKEIYGNSCPHVKSIGLGSLFTEKKTSIQPEIVHKKNIEFPPLPHLSPNAQTDKKSSQEQITDIDMLLKELEAPFANKLTESQKNIQTTAISFVAYCDALTKLVRQGASETLGLLKPEIEGDAYHSLKIISEELEQKNNEFPVKLKTALESEKSDPIFLRLHKIVSQAINSTRKLGEKEPISIHLIDINHPCNSYLNEIELLQHTITKK